MTCYSINSSFLSYQSHLLNISFHRTCNTASSSQLLPDPCLTVTMETWEGIGELTLTLAVGAGEVQQRPGLTNAATTRAQIQDFELVQPSTYPIYELMEHVMGPVLPNHSHRISTTAAPAGCLTGVWKRVRY